MYLPARSLHITESAAAAGCRKQVRLAVGSRGGGSQPAKKRFPRRSGARGPPCKYSRHVARIRESFAREFDTFFLQRRSPLADGQFISHINERSSSQTCLQRKTVYVLKYFRHLQTRTTFSFLLNLPPPLKSGLCRYQNATFDYTLELIARDRPLCMYRRVQVCECTCIISQLCFIY